MIRAFTLLTLTGTVLALTGCDDMDWGNSQQYKEDFQYSYELKPGGRLSVENLNGAIEILGQEGNKVEITGTKYAASEQVMKAMKIDVVASSDAIRVRTAVPSGHRGNMGARYVIRVPHRIELDRIESSNGAVRIEGVDGMVRVHTTNGAVRAMRVNGSAEIETSNGGIDLSDQRGSVVARTSNGRIKADGVKGYFEARTSNGGIDARVTDPEPNRPIKLESSNGGITLELASLKGNDVRVTTSNSSINLRLPQTVAAQLKASTSNSSISNDFESTMNTTSKSKHAVEGTIGSGGPIIDLHTSNGKINIQRY